MKNTGLVEVPHGNHIREIIFDIGGGIEKDRKFKAVQTEDLREVYSRRISRYSADFGSLSKIGSIMGSGGMIVLDESDCMVDIKIFLDFTVTNPVVNVFHAGRN